MNWLFNLIVKGYHPFHWSDCSVYNEPAYLILLNHAIAVLLKLTKDFRHMFVTFFVSGSRIGKCLFKKPQRDYFLKGHKMPRTFILFFPCASDLIASYCLFVFSCNAITMRFNDTRMIVIYKRQAPFFFNCLNYSLIHGNLLFMSPIKLLDCLLAKWTGHRDIARTECIEWQTNGLTPFAIIPRLYRVFSKMNWSIIDGGNSPYCAIRNILNAFPLFKFGTSEKKERRDD